MGVFSNVLDRLLAPAIDRRIAVDRAKQEERDRRLRREQADAKLREMAFSQAEYDKAAHAEILALLRAIDDQYQSDRQAVPSKS